MPIIAVAMAAVMSRWSVADGAYQAAVMSSLPSAYWSFEEATGDLRSHPATNAPPGTAFGPHVRGVPSASAALGSCIEFTGGGVRVPFSAWTQPTPNFSLELWARATTVTAPAHLAGSGRDIDAGSLKLAVYGPGAGHLLVAERRGTTVSNGAAASLDVPDIGFLGDWHHYVFVHDGSAGKASLFVDGSPVATNEFAMSDFATNSRDFVIAIHDYRGSGYPFLGRIDEVAIYQRALGAAEIIEHLCAASDDASPCCAPDLNEDGVVNGSDIAVILGFWGPASPAFPAADLNGDGAVNGSDLAAVLGAWGPCGG
jgi:hypothetical protein